MLRRTLLLRGLPDEDTYGLATVAVGRVQKLFLHDIISV